MENIYMKFHYIISNKWYENSYHFISGICTNFFITMRFIKKPHTKILKIRIKVLQISFLTLQRLEIKSKHEEWSKALENIKNQTKHF